MSSLLDEGSKEDLEGGIRANDSQIGGQHYKGFTIQHWDYAYDHEFDCFQYIITKWVDRWRSKGGLEDLKKARHALDKYIELAETEEARTQAKKAGGIPLDDSGEPGKEYVDQ